MQLLRVVGLVALACSCGRVIQRAEAAMQGEAIDCAALPDCPLDHDAVCGSDNRTYKNPCELEHARCKQRDDLHVVSMGACAGASDAFMESPAANGGSPSDDQAMSPDLDATPSMVNPYCTLHCSHAVVDPICGTDSVSYINECHLLATKCSMPELEKQHDGLCVVSTATARMDMMSMKMQPRRRLSPSNAAEYELSMGGMTTKQRCNPICPRIYEPMCGSNGVTYANQCLLDFASCEDPRVIKFADGRCATTTRSASSGAANRAASSCVPGPCPAVDAPVCGSDGQTYMNQCMLANAQCGHRALIVLHDGECTAESVPSCAMMTCPQFTECRESEAAGIAYCAEICTPDRCGMHERCELHDTECFTAPCSAVATCVPLDMDADTMSAA